MSAQACQHHNHAHCIQDALQRAEQLCAKKGVRLTALRHRVLELVWESHKPLGAYELLDRLTDEGHKPAPPTVYRALEFLQEQGLVHRIASRNAFIGCNQPEGAHDGYFLLCTACGNAEEMAETPAIDAAVQRAAQQTGFHIQNRLLEVTGLCQHCQEK